MSPRLRLPDRLFTFHFHPPIHVLCLLLALVAPRLLAASFTAGTLDGQTIRVCFDEPLELTSAENITNYNLILVRKEVKELSATEISEFVNAVKRLKTLPSQYKPRTNAYDYFVELHMEVMNFGIHQSPLFLPWHREFIRRFEAELQRISGNPRMTLPYWDWTSEESRNLIFTPDFLGGNGDTNDFGFVKDGPFRQGEFPIYVFDPTDEEFDEDDGDFPPPAGLWLSRAFGADSRVKTLPSAADVAEALTAGRLYDVYPWDLTSDASRSFRNYVEGWRRPNPSQMHNRVHVWIGGEMATGASPNDPAFFLNHANVDRIWAEWHDLYGSSTFPASFNGPRMFAFPEVTVESTFEIRDSGRRYSSQTGGASVLEARLQTDGTTVVLTVTNLGKGFSLAIDGVRTTNGLVISGSDFGRVPGVTHENIGISGTRGRALSCDQGAVSVQTIAAGLTDQEDAFHFLYHQQTGDFDLRVQVQKLGLVGNMAGVMARAGLDPRSPYLGLIVMQSETGKVWKVVGRPAAGIESLWIEPSAFSNAWLRLVRKGQNRYFIQASSNNLDWVSFPGNPVRLGLADNLPLVGLASASGESTSSSVIEYRGYAEVRPPPIPGLTIASQGGDVAVAWFTFDPNYVLEATSNPSTGPWIPIMRSAEWNNEADLPADAPAVFFRLRGIGQR